MPVQNPALAYREREVPPPPKVAPTATNLQTRMGVENAPYGFGVPSGFSSINPLTSSKYIPFAGGGRTSIAPEGLPINVYPSSTDITGRNVSTKQNVTALTGTAMPFSGMASPMLSSNPEGYSPFTPLSERLAPLPTGLPLATSMPIEGGPISLRGATAMTSPVTAAQQGRQEIQTPYGTIYATAEQASNMMTPRTLAQQGSRTSEQQQALIAQMRFQGADTMRKNIAENQRIVDERRANPQMYTTPLGNAISAPTNMYGQPIKSWTDVYKTAGTANEAKLAKTGRGIQSAASTQIASGFGSLAGGPSQYSNARAEERRQIRDLADAYGIQRPLSRGVENRYRQEFSRMGLI